MSYKEFLSPFSYVEMLIEILYTIHLPPHIQIVIERPIGVCFSLFSFLTYKFTLIKMTIENDLSWTDQT